MVLQLLLCNGPPPLRRHQVVPRHNRAERRGVATLRAQHLVARLAAVPPRGHDVHFASAARNTADAFELVPHYVSRGCIRRVVVADGGARARAPHAGYGEEGAVQVLVAGQDGLQCRPHRIVSRRELGALALRRLGRRPQRLDLRLEGRQLAIAFDTRRTQRVPLGGEGAQRRGGVLEHATLPVERVAGIRQLVFHKTQFRARLLRRGRGALQLGLHAGVVRDRRRQLLLQGTHRVLRRSADLTEAPDCALVLHDKRLQAPYSLLGFVPVGRRRSDLVLFHAERLTQHLVLATGCDVQPMQGAVLILPDGLVLVQHGLVGLRVLHVPHG
eukprot:PhM_4_TR1150/c0_g1_i1/m.11312